jgi:AMP-binding enzyme
MMLGDQAAAAVEPQASERAVTIDDLFRRVALLQSARLALADAPNRETFTDGAPRRLRYDEADRAVDAIAGRLRGMGLPADSIVAIQLPNIAENPLTILGVLRAGMIPAVLPLLWRRAEAVAALTRVGAKALITCGRVASFNHGQCALRIASEVFSIRYVGGFGANLPDGVVPFDDLFAGNARNPVRSLERESRQNAAAHIALLSFDVGTGGILPVARNHVEVLAGGLSVHLEGRLVRNAAILSTIAPDSFAGISLTLVPWLLSGGTLALHHPFDPDLLARQQQTESYGTMILPGPVALRLVNAAAYAQVGLGCLIAAWRSPQRLARSAAWRAHDTALVDVAIFGEAGVVPARRGADGRAVPLPCGPASAPRGSEDALVLAELVRTATGTLAMRGPMIPHHVFPPGIEHSGLAYFTIDRDGLVDTGYACRADAATRAMIVTGPPSGIVSVGGYRFSLHDLQNSVRHLDRNATLAALPDPITGQRLIGSAADCNSLRAALDALGLNPLVVAAFRDRSGRSNTASA